MTVSIIIAVKALNNNLKECLEHCLNLDYPDFEIIVFPDELFSYQNNRVKIIPTGNITPPKKRDLSLKEAQGEILAFIDDDAYPDRNWLKNAVGYFLNKDIAAVCGPALTPTTDSLLQKASGLVYESFLVSGVFSYRYKRKPKREVEDFPSCNFLVRKDIFAQSNGFKTNFWPGEDTFLCLEITKRLHKRIVYVSEVVVYHHRRALCLPHLKQVTNYALHRGYFAKRFPETSFNFFYFIPTVFLIFIILGIPLVSLFPIFKLIYLSLLISYLFLVFIFSIRRNFKLTCLVFFGILITHMGYGFFFLKGLLSPRLKEENN